MASQKESKRGKLGDDEVVERILKHIKETRSFDFTNYKRGTLSRRIERRMLDRRCNTKAEYVALLERDPKETDVLISSMLIKVTGFFRDTEMWEILSSRLIPQMLAEKRPGEDIRVWCAGCATGEEAFSVAVLLAEAMGPAFQNQDVKIFGTDLDEKAVAFARRGFYSSEQVKSVSPGMRKAWFVELPEGWTVRKELRRSVVFGVNNLVSDAPISRLDLLLCRNVFIYLDGQLQRRVLTRFHYALRRHGVLVLGKSELIPFASKIFEPLNTRWRIYRKDGRRDTAVQQERLVSLLEADSVARTTEDGRAESSDVEDFHRDVVHSAHTPLIAVATDGTVLLWNPAAAALWGRTEHEVMGKKLGALALPGLSGELLVEKSAAVRSGQSDLEHAEGALIRAGHPSTHLSVEVTPLHDGGREVIALLYAVQDVTRFRGLEEELRKSNEERQSALEEAQSVNEELQSANEELETTNEELQSANEELQTTNEELQSTNEELETTNEELQSTNAELDATNRELAHRTEELNSGAFLQRAIIRALSAAVVVLDPNGRIRIWNLTAERLFGIPENEAVGQLLWTLNVRGLRDGTLQKVRSAFSRNASFRAESLVYELPNGSQGYLTIAAVPILDEGSSLGAVIVFEDTTRAANLAEELATAKRPGGGNGNGNGNGKRNQR